MQTMDISNKNKFPTAAPRISPTFYDEFVTTDHSFADVDEEDLREDILVSRLVQSSRKRPQQQREKWQEDNHQRQRKQQASNEFSIVSLVVNNAASPNVTTTDRQDQASEAPQVVDTIIDDDMLEAPEDELPSSSLFNFTDPPEIETISIPCWNETLGFFNCTNNDTLIVTETPTVTIPTFAPTQVPSAMPVRPGLITSTNTEVLVSTIKIYGSIYLALTAAFCVVRKLYPRLFNIRSWVPGLQCDLAKNSNYGWVSWLWEVFYVDDDDVMEQCGMDALCFIRSITIGRKLAMVGCFHAIWLIPVYYTANESEETAYLEDNLALVSAAALPPNSPRFLATVICAYTVFGYAMVLIKREVEWYTEKRHKFLCQRRPRNYAVYVSGIPVELRTSKKLADFFRQSGATSSVLEAHVTLACPLLESLVAQRGVVIAQLEHARAYETMHGKRKSKWELNLWGDNNLTRGRGISRDASNSNFSHTSGLVATVDSIETLEIRLRQLTKDIAIAYQNIERSIDPYTLDEHRDMVMQEIEDLRQAERAQQIANCRERSDEGDHDVTNAEEIIHDPSLLKKRSGQSSQSHDRDGFSQAAEAFFLGDLSRAQQLQREQEHQLLLTGKGKGTDRDRQNLAVSFQTTHNSVHSPTNTISDTPSSDAEESEYDVANYMNGLQFASPPWGRTPSSMESSIESESLFNNSPYHQQGNHQRHNSKNHFFQNPGQAIKDMPSIDEDEISESTDEDGYLQVQKAIRQKLGDDSNSSHGTKGSRRSWSSSGGTSGALKKIGGLGKAVVEVGAGVAVTATKQVGDLGNKGVAGVNKGVVGVGAALKHQGLQVAELGVENLKTIQASAAAVIPAVMAHKEGMPLEAGFVVFKDIYSRQAAMQMLHHPVSGVMLVSEAPGRSRKI